MASWADTLFESFTGANADRAALSIADRIFSYSTIWAAGRAFAQRLDDSTPAGARIGILAHRSPEAYVAILGCALAGRPYVPINPKLPQDRKTAVARIASCAALATDDASQAAANDIAAALDGVALLRPEIEVRATAGEVAAPPPAAVDDRRHLYVMFTSGTTGEPKGVAVRRENVAAYVQAVRRFAPVQADERCSQFFDLSFDLSVHDIFVTWTSGGCLCVPVDAEMVDPIGFAAKAQLDCWFSVPSVVALGRRFRRLKPDVLPGLRLSLFCGEPLPTSLAIQWADTARKAEIWNLYGPTEATIAITAQRFDPRDEPGFPASVPLGVAYENCAAVVVNAEGAPAAGGEVGELWLAGPQITDGYINAPQEQAAKFVAATLSGHPHQLWYRTGDLVKNDPKWGLVFQSRLDDQVKISGYRVELLEIEEVLRRAAESADVAAVPWPLSEDGGSAEGVVGFVCGSAKTDREIIDACRTWLPPYMVPRKILFPSELPLNANGKIDRKALRAQHLETAPKA